MPGLRSRAETASRPENLRIGLEQQQQGETTEEQRCGSSVRGNANGATQSDTLLARPGEGQLQNEQAERRNDGDPHG